MRSSRITVWALCALFGLCGRGRAEPGSELSWRPSGTLPTKNKLIIGMTEDGNGEFRGERVTVQPYAAVYRDDEHNGALYVIVSAIAPDLLPRRIEFLFALVDRDRTIPWEGYVFTPLGKACPEWNMPDKTWKDLEILGCKWNMSAITGSGGVVERLPGGPGGQEVIRARFPRLKTEDPRLGTIQFSVSLTGIADGNRTRPPQPAVIQKQVNRITVAQVKGAAGADLGADGMAGYVVGLRDAHHSVLRVSDSGNTDPETGLTRGKVREVQPFAVLYGKGPQRILLVVVHAGDMRPDLIEFQVQVDDKDKPWAKAFLLELKGKNCAEAKGQMRTSRELEAMGCRVKRIPAKDGETKIKQFPEVPGDWKDFQADFTGFRFPLWNPDWVDLHVEIKGVLHGEVRLRDIEKRARLGAASLVLSPGTTGKGNVRDGRGKTSMPTRAAAVLLGLAGVGLIGWRVSGRKKSKGLAVVSKDVAPNVDRDKMILRRTLTLLDEQNETEAWETLEGIPREKWKKEEYAAAIRIHRRLRWFVEAKTLFKEVQALLPLRESVEIHYYFGLFCEKMGDVVRAKRVFLHLIEVFGNYKDAKYRVEMLDALSAEDLSHLNTVLKVTGQTEPGARTMTGAPPAAAQKTLIDGRYEFLRPLGTGGMGYVFQAKDVRLDRLVALKKVREGVASNKAFKEQLYEEARTQASLPSTYIVPLHDIVEAKGETYLVFEYIDGETVSDIIAGKGALSPRDCKNILIYVCRGLADAHENGVVHQDLKPANVMARRKGGVLVMDFGIAKHAGDSGGGGTPVYMAPEQHNGSTTYQSDIYTIGVTAYEMLTARLPFKNVDLLRQKEAEDYLALDVSIPKNMRDIVTACLRASAKDRPQSARDVERMLKAVAV